MLKIKALITFRLLIESPEPQQCTDEKCQEPECQYNMQLQQEQMQQQQQQHQHQIIQPIQTQPHIHQIHYTYSRRTSLDSNALDVCAINFFSYTNFWLFRKYEQFSLLIFNIFQVLFIQFSRHFRIN